jgi:TonB family protein
MPAVIRRKNGAFRRAVLLSAVFHVTLFTLLALSPSLPLTRKTGLIHYIPLSLGGLGGGGGQGGGGGPASTTTLEPTPLPAAKKPSLRDLTVAQNIKPEGPSSKLRYPVEKPKREPKAKKPKAASITEPPAFSKTNPAGAAESSGGTGGSGVRIGLGGPGGGSGYDSQVGLSNFPYTYYLQAVTDRISANWFTSLVDPGVRGNFQTVVYFKILRNGRTTDASIKESSGIESLDLSALRAIQRSTPFPPLPSDYNQEYLGIFLIFEHNK